MQIFCCSNPFNSSLNPPFHLNPCAWQIEKSNKIWDKSVQKGCSHQKTELWDWQWMSLNWSSFCAAFIFCIMIQYSSWQPVIVLFFRIEDYIKLERTNKDTVTPSLCDRFGVLSGSCQEATGGWSQSRGPYFGKEHVALWKQLFIQMRLEIAHWRRPSMSDSAHFQRSMRGKHGVTGRGVTRALLCVDNYQINQTLSVLCVHALAFLALPLPVVKEKN